MEVRARVARVKAKDRLKMRAEILLNVEYFVTNPESEHAKKLISLGAVHNKFLGLEVFYMTQFTTQYTEDGRHAVTYHMLRNFEISLCELERAAHENTEKNNKFVAVRISEAITVLQRELKLPEKEMEDIDAFVLTTRNRKNGASSLLFLEMFKKAADELASDLYVLPCSMDELVVIPQEGYGSAKELKALVQSVNEGINNRKEVLSNDVYKYCRENGKLSIADEND